MNLNEQLLRSRYLMCESDEDLKSVFDDFIMEYFSAGGKIKIDSVFTPSGINLIIEVDFSLYGRFSPNFDESYYNEIQDLLAGYRDDSIKRFFGRKFIPKDIIFTHKNVDTVINLISNDIENALSRYSNEGYCKPEFYFGTTHKEPYLIMVILKKNRCLAFNALLFEVVLNKLYGQKYDSLVLEIMVDDFNLTKNVTKIYNKNGKLIRF